MAVSFELMATSCLRLHSRNTGVSLPMKRWLLSRMAVAALQDGNVGMTFGGVCFAGHGVNISGGTARFSVVS